VEICIHTYQSRFISEEIAETSQIFLRDTHILPKLVATRNTADVTRDNPIAIQSQSISGVSAINPLVDFHDIHGRNLLLLRHESIILILRQFILRIYYTTTINSK
jgi:hypothetical protein